MFIPCSQHGSYIKYLQIRYYWRPSYSFSPDFPVAFLQKTVPITRSIFSDLSFDGHTSLLHDVVSSRCTMNSPLLSFGIFCSQSVYSTTYRFSLGKLIIVNTTQVQFDKSPCTLPYGHDTVTHLLCWDAVFISCDTKLHHTKHCSSIWRTSNFSSSLLFIYISTHIF